MTQSDDLTHNVHDLVPPAIDPNNTPDDQDEDQVDGGEVNEDLDKLHDEAFGDENNQTITKEVNEDEIARVKDLDEEEQESEE